MSGPSQIPVGLDLVRAAKTVSRAFEARLVEAGWTLPVWLVLLSVKAQATADQSGLAKSMGIEGATLTHHLNRLETDGVLTRTRDPENRRRHRVALTQKGEALFLRLRESAIAFDRQLRAGIPDEDLQVFTAVLARFRGNVGADSADTEQPIPGPTQSGR